MAIPSSREARRFYRCALQRFEEAQVLVDAGYSTGSAYLAGYSVECILKSLLLAVSPAGDRSARIQSFRGNRAHDFEWLRSQYLEAGGSRFPASIVRHFTYVSSWSTDLRYLPQTIPGDETVAFLASVESILQWANGRLS